MGRCGRKFVARCRFACADFGWTADDTSGSAGARLRLRAWHAEPSSSDLSFGTRPRAGNPAKEPALGPDSPTRYSACIGLARFVEAVSCEAVCGERTSRAQLLVERAAEDRERQSRKPEGCLRTPTCPLMRTLERGLWRAAGRSTHLRMRRGSRRLGEASGDGGCGEGRSSKQADKRPPAEPRSSSKRTAEMPARRAEAR